MKFKDADAGGDKDATETGLSGWEIHLFGTDGSGAAVHQHTTTTANGTYSFSVKPGTYKVCETDLGQARMGAVVPVGHRPARAHTHGGALTPGPAGYASVTVTSGGDRER